MLLDPTLHAGPVFNTVVCVLERQCDAKILLELSLVHEAAEELRSGVSKRINRAQRPKSILIAAAEGVGGARARRNPRRLITVGHYRFGLAERRRVTADHRHYIIRGHRAL